ncbi:MAG: class I SAM-dependent methyltransferase [Nitrososphaeraceae archaeon]|nr:class I SAM-dependent methyltransferase [Nitrososphaeraceae archaeon]MBV9666634.1 class I SAM-dependent methyltransferase [Nitrososphaeraceae archaeon]
MTHQSPKTNSQQSPSDISSSKSNHISTYNPQQYWTEQGKTYKEQFRYNKDFRLQEQMLIDYLKRIFPLSSSLTVLELGCGFGRITKLLLLNFPNIKEYLAVDLSQHQIENAKEYVRPQEIIIKKKEEKANPDIKFLVSDIQSLQVDKKYDLVIASEVLMHVLPSEINEVICKLVNLSNKHIVNIDWYEKQIPKRVAPHNFIHIYEEIYKNIPSITLVNRIPIEKKKGWLSSKIDAKQSIFHALK